MLVNGDADLIEKTAEQVRHSTGATYVVVTNRDGIRYSHPNPAMIGKPVDENPSTVLAGNTWVGVQQGTLGVSARGKAPIFYQGKVIGLVSVGFLETTVFNQLLTELPGFAVTVLIALGLGAECTAQEAARPAAVKEIQLSFKRDPRMVDPYRGIGPWVTGSNYTGATAQDTVEAHAEGVDAGVGELGAPVRDLLAPLAAPVLHGVDERDHLHARLEQRSARSRTSVLMPSQAVGPSRGTPTEAYLARLKGNYPVCTPRDSRHTRGGCPA